MSYYEDPVIYDTRDDDIEAARAKSQGGPVVARAYTTAWYPSYDSKWLWIFICLVMLGLVIFAVISAASASTTVQTQMLTHSMDMEQLKERSNPFDSHAFYSLVSNRKDEYRSTFCHSGLYRLVSQGEDDDTGAVNVMQSLSTERLEQVMGQKPYALQIHVPIRFNVDSKSLPEQQTPRTRLKQDDDQRYMVARVELAANYAGFSTIRLVETSLDIYRKSFKTTRAITLCSDDPISSVGRCRRHITIDGTMVMNVTYVVTMDQAQSSGGSAPGRRTGSNATTVPGPRGSSRDGMDGVSISDNGRSERHAIEENIAHIRLYHLLFYTEYSEAADGDGDGHVDISTSSGNGADYRGDYLSLSAQVTPC